MHLPQGGRKVKIGTGSRWSRLRRLLFALGLLAALLTGCGQSEDAPATAQLVALPAAESATLTVFAAASLSDAFAEIGRVFEESHPGVNVVFNFAGSNQLTTQIAAGAPADVFASANVAQMDVAVASGRVDAGAPQRFVTNRLVVVYPADNPAGIVGLVDLSNPDILIVLAAEEVPVGRYSLEFLERASVAPAFGASFKDGVLDNVVSYEENVRSVLTKVALGEADAGIVYSSDLVGVAGVASLEIPDGLNVLAEYPIASLNDSAQAGAAGAFVALVLSDRGQAILASYGFGPAPAQ